MKRTLFLAGVGVAVLGITMWPEISSPHLAAGDAKGGKGNPLSEAIQKRCGKPDRVTGADRKSLHYDLPNGDTLTFVVSAAKVGIEHKGKGEGTVSDAVQSRLGKPDRSTGSGRAFLHYDLPNGETLTIVVSDRVLGAYLDDTHEDVLFPLPPREVAAGMFEKWQQETAKKPSSVRYTRVEYDRKAYWLVESSFGYGDPSERIAVYAPTKDGAFRQCLLAGPIKAGTLAVTADARTGILELREEARSGTKGEVVLSCNLKAIDGSP
jgi:hypothetical protein